MSDEKIERILSTYKAVDGRPDYVWVGENKIVKRDILREAYIEHFKEKTDK